MGLFLSLFLFLLMATRRVQLALPYLAHPSFKTLQKCEAFPDMKQTFWLFKFSLHIMLKNYQFYIIILYILSSIQKNNIYFYLCNTHCILRKHFISSAGHNAKFYTINLTAYHTISLMSPKPHTQHIQSWIHILFPKTYLFVSFLSSTFYL